MLVIRDFPAFALLVSLKENGANVQQVLQNTTDVTWKKLYENKRNYLDRGLGLLTRCE
jgi:hypothetical protein